MNMQDVQSMPTPQPEYQPRVDIQQSWPGTQAWFQMGEVWFQQIWQYAQDQTNFIMEQYDRKMADTKYQELMATNGVTWAKEAYEDIESVKRAIQNGWSDAASIAQISGLDAGRVEQIMRGEAFKTIELPDNMTEDLRRQYDDQMRDLNTGFNRQTEQFDIAKERGQVEFNWVMDSLKQQAGNDIAKSRFLGAATGMWQSTHFIDAVEFIRSEANKNLEKLQTRFDWENDDIARARLQLVEDFEHNNEKLRYYFDKGMDDLRNQTLMKVQAIKTQYGANTADMTEALKSLYLDVDRMKIDHLNQTMSLQKSYNDMMTSEIDNLRTYQWELEKREIAQQAAEADSLAAQQKYEQSQVEFDQKNRQREADFAQGQLWYDLDVAKFEQQKVENAQWNYQRARDYEQEGTRLQQDNKQFDLDYNQRAAQFDMENEQWKYDFDQTAEENAQRKKERQLDYDQRKAEYVQANKKFDYTLEKDQQALKEKNAGNYADLLDKWLVDLAGNLYPEIEAGIDRNEAISKYGSTPAVRNFNPGNIEDLWFWGKDDPNERFTVFNSPKEWFDALVQKIDYMKDWKSRVYDPNWSFYDYFGTYAPDSDNNNSRAYAQQVATRLWVSPDSAIWRVDAVALASEISRHEDPNMHKLLIDSGVITENGERGQYKWVSWASSKIQFKGNAIVGKDVSNTVLSGWIMQLASSMERGVSYESHSSATGEHRWQCGEWYNDVLWTKNGTHVWNSYESKQQFVDVWITKWEAWMWVVYNPGGVAQQYGHIWILASWIYQNSDGQLWYDVISSNARGKEKVTKLFVSEKQIASTNGWFIPTNVSETANSSYATQAQDITTSLEEARESTRELKDSDIINYNDTVSRRDMSDEDKNFITAERRKVFDDPNADIQDILRMSAWGKDMTDTQMKPIQKYTQALSQLNVLEKQVKKTRTWPIIWRLRELNEYDTDRKVLETTLKWLVPTVARSVYWEVWVLTDSDINHYTKTLPNLRNTNDQNTAIMALNIQLFMWGLKSQMAVSARSWYDVDGLYWTYLEMEAKANSMRESVGMPPIGQERSWTFVGTGWSSRGGEEEDDYSKFISSSNAVSDYLSTN